MALVSAAQMHKSRDQSIKEMQGHSRMDEMEREK